MNWEQFVRGLRQGERSGGYLLSGDDRYLKSKALEQLQGSLFQGGKGEVIRHQAPGGTAEAARDAATYPFFCAMRLIVVENAEAVPAEARKLLEPLLKEPSPFATLVFVTGEETEGKGCPKWMAAGTTEVVCSATPGEIRRWIQGWFKRQGLRAESRAVEVLVRRSGGKFGSIIPELEKISLVCSPGDTVTVETAEATSLDHSEEEIFALTDALLTGDRRRGTQALEDLLAQGQPAGQILGMLERSLKLRWALSGTPAAADEDLARALRVSARWVATARRKGEGAKADLARRLWGALEEADERLKTGAHNESLILLRGIEAGLPRRG